MNKDTLTQAVKEYEYIHGIFILLNREGSEFQKEFINFVPSMEADIRSSSLNEDCSCTEKINKYVEDNKDRCIEFLVDMINRSVISDIDFEALNKKHRRISVVGKVAKTSIQDWPNFISNLDEINAVYRNMHLVKENDDIYVFFS